MSQRTYLQRFKKKLLERGDEWKCHYCRILFIPDDVAYDDPRYYSNKENGWYIKQPDGSEIGFREPLSGYSDHPTIDHIIPKSKGGLDDLSNLVFACRQCNCKKHAKVLS